MPVFSPDVLADWTKGSWESLPSAAITGFTIDSRQAKAGDCFVALRTGQRDGHAFLQTALEAGAVAALVEEAQTGVPLPQLVVPDTLKALQSCARAHREGFPGTVIGITGSAGKTSTKELLARMLGGEDVLSTEGNLNNFLGLPLMLLRLDAQQHRFAVMETGINQKGEMAELASILRPDAAILTNVGAAHLEGLGSLQGVAAEKSHLLAAVPASGWKVLPADCLQYPECAGLPGQCAILAEAAETPGANVFFRTKLQTSAPFGFNRAALQENPGGYQLELTLPGAPAHFFDLPLMSAGMRSNTALAATAALLLGGDPVVVAAALADWRPPPLRGEVRVFPRQHFYIDCYNANPLSMQDSLAAFSERYSGWPRLFLIGSMRELGDQCEKSHRRVGKSLRLEEKDRAVFIGEHARSYREGALEGGNLPERIVLCASALEAASELAGFEGAVFLKGSRAFGLESLIPKQEASASC